MNGLRAGGLSRRSTRQACFFSALNPREPSTRQRTIDWKRTDDEPRMVLCKHCNRFQNTIVFSTSFYTVLEMQIWYFIIVAVRLLFCTTMCRQAHWTRLSLLQVKFCSKGKRRLQSSRRRLLANELTCAYQVNEKHHIHKTTKRKNNSHSKPDKTSLEFSDDDCRFDQESCTRTDRKRRVLSCIT